MPAVRPLDHPAVRSLSGLLRKRGHATIWDVCDVNSPLRTETNVVKVVTLIGAQVLLNDPRRRPADDHRIQRRSELDLIVDVGPREYYSKRDSLTIDDKVPFGPELTAIGRFSPVLSPLLPVRKPLRCPVTATSSRCLCGRRIRAGRASRVGKRSRRWSISGSAHGPLTRSHTHAVAFSIGIRFSAHTEFR